MGTGDPVLRGQILTEGVMKLGRGFEQCREERRAFQAEETKSRCSELGTITSQGGER